MYKQCEIVQACIHAVELAIENHFHMDPEVNILVCIQLNSKHFACTADQFEHAICQGYITGLEIPNGVNQGLAGFNELLKKLPVIRITDNNIDDFS
jgi:hypothetical protein